MRDDVKSRITKRRLAPVQCVCDVCGRSFENWGYYRRKTCSDACHLQIQSEKHRGRPAKMTDAQLARIAEMGRTTVVIARRAAAISPRSGPFETHHEAKEWVVISPKGVRHPCRNLNHFCRSTFGKEWKRYSRGLNQHARWLRGTLQDTCSNYKGWTLEI